jgi:predicted nicotinamide N-methyase
MAPHKTADQASIRQIKVLQRRLEARRRVTVRTVPILGAPAPFRIAVPANPDAVLDELASVVNTSAPDAAAEPHMPYWATPWASGIALAEVLLSRQAEVSNKLVLELGCGLGITAAAALAAGAALSVADCFAETLTYCRYNALTNAGAAPRTLLADWRSDTGRRLLVGAGPFDLVLAADVLYEAEDVEPLLALVPKLLRASGRFWLAEPGRTTSARFVAEAKTSGWREAEPLVLERDWPGGAGHARITVHFYEAVR